MSAPNPPTSVPFKPPRRVLDKELLTAMLVRNGVPYRFTWLPSEPTHFNKLHHMVMRRLLITTDCGPSDDEIRELLTFLAELGVVNFSDDLVWV